MVESLVDVDKNLRQRGARLLLLEGDSSVSITSLLTLLTQRGYAPTLYKNRDRMGYKVLERETAVETFCNQNDITIYTGSAYFLLSPQQSYDNWIKHYCEYQEATEWKTPDQLYSDNNLNEVAAELPHITADELVSWVVEIMGQVKRAGLFVGGETEAQRTLASFLHSRYHGYHWKLSRPYLAEHGATSQLSPHIAFGTISTRHINSKAYAMKQRLKIDAPDEVRTLASFLSCLRWRDSFTQRYALHPELKWHNAYPEFDVIYTAEPLQGVYKQRFEHWKDDLPLLDASMRALNEHGWMNFRMRAQCATMLTIIFGVSWHHGAEYFMQKLVDGDVAINHWQWQMQAGVTNPLSDTFRIYNPTTNLKERDPKLQYIHEWLPEYADCQTVDDVLNQAQPIVDWSYERRTRGGYISHLRRLVRERLQREGGAELYQAQLMLRTATRIAEQYKQSATSPPTRTACSAHQLSLFEHGDA